MLELRQTRKIVQTVCQIRSIQKIPETLECQIMAETQPARIAAALVVWITAVIPEMVQTQPAQIAAALVVWITAVIPEMVQTQPAQIAAALVVQEAQIREEILEVVAMWMPGTLEEQMREALAVVTHPVIAVHRPITGGNRQNLTTFKNLYHSRERVQTTAQD